MTTTTAAGAIPLGTAPTTTPDRVGRAATRIDPHWDGVWSRGSEATWSTLADIKAQALARGRSPLPARVDLTGKAARNRLDRFADWQATLNVLACLDTYRTLSGEQLAWLTGNEQIASNHPRLMWDLFTLGLVDFGMTRSGVDGSEVKGARLYRPAQTRAFDDLIAPKLTYEEWVSVTGGTPWESTGQYDRHNILTNEVLLRAAEFLPVGAVTGEKHADLETLGYTSLGYQPPVMRIQRAADGVIARGDGVRIAIETTASTGKSFTEKCERWARLLHDRRYADSGLLVVFIVAPRGGRSNSSQRSTVEMVQRTIARAANLAPGYPGDRTLDRMLVVGWETWFPARHEVSRNFFRLVARTATGPDPLNPWQERPLLSREDFPAPENPKLHDSARILASLRAQPQPLASKQVSPQLWRVASERSGVGALEPKTVSTRTGTNIPSPATPKGSAGPFRIPARLLPADRD